MVFSSNPDPNTPAQSSPLTATATARRQLQQDDKTVLSPRQWSRYSLSTGNSLQIKTEDIIPELEVKIQKEISFALGTKASLNNISYWLNIYT